MEDIEMSTNSDSEIGPYKIKDDDCYIIPQEPSDKDAKENAIDVKRKVGMIESKIFKEIDKRDIE